MAYFFVITTLCRVILNLIFGNHGKESLKKQATASKGSRTSGLKQIDRTFYNKGRHYPTVVFSDGITAAVRLDISCQICDPLKYDNDARDSLAILSKLADERFRQHIENFSFTEAKRKRRTVEYRLKKELRSQFKKYGIKLQSITIGSIQARK